MAEGRLPLFPGAARRALQWLRGLPKGKPEAAHLQAGRWGEQQAVRFLKAKGWKIAGQRVRVGRHDEIDIVARHQGVLVFVEVKARRNERYGRPFSAVGREKRRRLARAAVAYLKRERVAPDHFRFDVVEVVGSPGGGEPELRHIENAFALGPRYRLWW